MLEMRVRSLEETTSTNNEIKAALRAGEPEGLVVRARRQTAAYGRQGRTWASPAGGLYFSMLLRPSVPIEQLSTLSLVVAIALREAIEGVGVRGALVKWPNDVVLAAAGDDGGTRGEVDGALAGSAGVGDRALASSRERAGVEGPGSAPQGGSKGSKGSKGSEGVADATLRRGLPFRKLCGISLEAIAGGVCVGVGVNVVRPQGAAASSVERVVSAGKNAPAFVAEALSAAVPVAGCASDDASRLIDEVFEAFCDAFARRYGRWCSEGFGVLVDAFNRHAALTGRHIELVDVEGNSLGAGTVIGVDPHGRLRLATADGRETALSSGEAHIV